MTQTITLPQNLVNAADALKQDLGFGDVEATIKYLLQTAIAREKKASRRALVSKSPENTAPVR